MMQLAQSDPSKYAYFTLRNSNSRYPKEQGGLWRQSILNTVVLKAFSGPNFSGQKGLALPEASPTLNSNGVVERKK